MSNEGKRIVSEKPVKTVKDLVEFLKKVDESTKIGWLDFDGLSENLVIDLDNDGEITIYELVKL